MHQNCPLHDLPMTEPFLLDHRQGRWMCPLCRTAYIERIWRKAQEELERDLNDRQPTPRSGIRTR
jgi:hypothetical protein